VVLTEKLDGTNAAIGIRPVATGTVLDPEFERVVDCGDLGQFAIRAQSRKRLIRPGADNFGFASWAFDNADTLVPFLGEGLHYGEWWGAGIQRTYGLSGRHWSLFNTHRWAEPMLYAPQEVIDLGVGVVPVLGIWGGNDIGRGLRQVLADLKNHGSPAAINAEGVEFRNPEGVVTYWTANNSLLKYILDHPTTPKGLVANTQETA